MSANPYRAPADGDAPIAPGVDRRRAAAAFVAWLVGLSLVRGVVLAAATGSALSAFGAVSRIAGLVAVSALRGFSAHTAASAAGFALVFGSRRAAHSAHARGQVHVGWLFAAVPPAMPVAATTSILTAVVTALLFDVPLSRSVEAVRGLVVPGDLVFGVLAAGFSTAALGLLAPLAVRALGRARWGLLAEIVAVQIGVWFITTIVAAVLTHLAGPDPGSGQAAP